MLLVLARLTKAVLVPEYVRLAQQEDFTVSLIAHATFYDGVPMIPTAYLYKEPGTHKVCSVRLSWACWRHRLGKSQVHLFSSSCCRPARPSKRSRERARWPRDCLAVSRLPQQQRQRHQQQRRRGRQQAAQTQAKPAGAVATGRRKRRQGLEEDPTVDCLLAHAHLLKKLDMFLLLLRNIAVGIT